MLDLPDAAGKIGRRCASLSEGSRLVSLSLCSRVSYCPAPRARVRLLGPCFKTGRRGDRQQPQTPGVERERHRAGRRPRSEHCEQFPKRVTGEPGRPDLQAGRRGISPRPSSQKQQRAYNTRERATLRDATVSPTAGRGPRRTLVQRRDAFHAKPLPKVTASRFRLRTA